MSDFEICLEKVTKIVEGGLNETGLIGDENCIGEVSTSGEFHIRKISMLDEDSPGEVSTSGEFHIREASSYGEGRLKEIRGISKEAAPEIRRVEENCV